MYIPMYICMYLKRRLASLAARNASCMPGIEQRGRIERPEWERRRIPVIEHKNLESICTYVCTCICANAVTL